MVLSTFWRMDPLLEVLLYVFHYRSRWWRSTALPLRCGSWVHVTCANWPGTLYWWADLSTMYVCMYVCRLVYQSTNMLVLGRNQIFTFCCIFRLCCHIQNAVVLNFCWGWGYTCYICLYAVCVSPTHPQQKFFATVVRMLRQYWSTYIAVQFILGPTTYVLKITKINKYKNYSHPLTFNNMHNVLAPSVTTHPGQTTLNWPELPWRGTRWQQYHKNQCS